MSRFFSVLLLVLFGAGFALFFLPVPIYGVFNIGNISGMLLFGALFCCVLFRGRLKALLRRLVQPAAGKIALCAAVVVLAAVCAVAAVMGVRIIRAAKNAPPRDADLTVVVLGCRVYDSGPSRMLWSRINTARDYLLAYPNAVCILSGGQGDDEPESEAQAMYDALIAAGVDGTRLIREDQSRSTLQNVTFSMQLIEEKELPAQIALVTNEYHQYRAGLFAAAAGCEQCYALSAPSQKLLVPTYVLREMFGLVYMRLGGEASFRVL